jgi:uncharacterized protein (DUF302 family)
MVNAAWAAATALLLSLTGAPAPASDPVGTLIRVDKVSSKDFAATAKAMETWLRSLGFVIVARIDHQGTLRTAGAGVKRSMTIEFARPEFNQRLISMAPEAGLEMPGRFYVWERADGKTVVSYYQPSGAFRTYRNEALAEIGSNLDVLWDKLTSEATR